MNRRFKKFLYGIFYLCLFGLILFSFYKSVFAPAPTCFDKKQNQGENGTDCGGPCGSCDVLNLEPIKVLGEARVFGLDSGKAVIAAEIKNPNANFGASFSYNFKIYGNKGNLLEMKQGKESIFQSEDKFIFEPDIATGFQNISKAQIEISEPEWFSARNLTRPDLEIADISTINDVNGIKVGGVIKNKGAFAAHDLRVVAFVLNKRGFEIFASKTVVSDIQSFSNKTFVINFPADAGLAQKVDSDATEIFVSSSF